MSICVCVIYRLKEYRTNFYKIWNVDSRRKGKCNAVC